MDGMLTQCKSISIYALVDPTTRECRYIGKSSRPDKRIKEHFKAGSKTHRDFWIKSIRPEVPEMLILETTDVDQWEDSERWWISYFKFMGARLVNGTSGGEGGRGLKHNEHTKKLLSLALKGKPKSEETKAKMKANCSMKRPEVAEKIAAQKRGKPRSEETKTRLREALKGNVITEETRRKISESNKGKKHTDEAREKMSVAQSNRSPEHRAKLSASLKGRVFTPEWRAKIIESRKRNKLKKEQHNARL